MKDTALPDVWATMPICSETKSTCNKFRFARKRVCPKTQSAYSNNKTTVKTARECKLHEISATTEVRDI